MKRILKSPLTNAACLSLFTAFYGFLFLTRRPAAFWGPYHESAGVPPFWAGWGRFLARGHHAAIAYALIALTVLVVLMLLLRRRPYDEYHVANLLQCLAAAAVLTLTAIAVFYLMILYDSSGILEKFTLFITVHWATVVLADLAYVLICRWR